MQFSSFRATRDTSIQVDLTGAANNPCFIGSSDIDYDGIVTIDLSNRKVSFEGHIDGFPAFEMYATSNDGSGVPIFTASIPPGDTPWDLPGEATRDISGEAKI